MKKTAAALCFAMLLAGACNKPDKKHEGNTIAFNKMLNQYWDEQARYFPLEATTNGDNRYNDLLPNDGSKEYISKLKSFFTSYLDSVKKYDRASLNENDQISYDVFKREMEMRLENFNYHPEYFPINQFWGLTLSFPQLGSGEGNQPFKTVKDYDNFLGRINGFTIWTDTAITNMREGMNKGYVLPRVLVERMIPQLNELITTDVKKNIFYGPITKLPSEFTVAEKQRLTDLYIKAINKQIVPSYSKLSSFLKNEYLKNSRTTFGIYSFPQGKEYYNFLIRYWTTTNKTSEEIFETGLKEVARIRSEMEKVKSQVGFQGNLMDFFKYTTTDKKFMPFKTPKEIIDTYWAVKAKEAPMLKKLFLHEPKTKFEIRQTEAFRAASASAEYNQGSADGSRPGIFYTPILDASKFNLIGMETLFLHEAIPGHHYQISLQQENESLPKFRRFAWYGAYGEGWALYAETLGKELGLFTDPYQYLGHLSDAMLRAVRLVVDVGIHAKGWSREKAIDYLLENMPVSKEEATSAVERYMAIPGQALSYKIGQLKISELRQRYQTKLGRKFDIAKFHDAVLRDGCLPLDVFEAKMDRWAESK